MVLVTCSLEAAIIVEALGEASLRVGGFDIMRFRMWLHFKMHPQTRFTSVTQLMKKNKKNNAIQLSRHIVKGEACSATERMKNECLRLCRGSLMEVFGFWATCLLLWIKEPVRWEKLSDASFGFMAGSIYKAAWWVWTQLHIRPCLRECGVALGSALACSLL